MASKCPSLEHLQVWTPLVEVFAVCAPNSICVRFRLDSLYLDLEHVFHRICWPEVIVEPFTKQRILQLNRNFFLFPDLIPLNHTEQRCVRVVL